jgi:hypothetical protein
VFVRARISILKLSGILLFTVYPAFVFLACATEVDESSGGGVSNAESGNNNGGHNTKTFWAQDLTDNEFYKLNAELMAEGKHCKIWVEQASKPRCNSLTAKKIAEEFDKNIYIKMVEVFGIGRIQVNETSSDDTIKMADWLTDRDGKLSILLLDIKDGYTPQNGSYTAGYFSMLNMFEKNSIYPYNYSNTTDMIYIDTYPAKPGSSESYQTLAHETQHLMNFVTSLICRDDETYIHLMDTWIDEGLSSAAEYIYLGKQVEERWKWFNTDRNGTIALGNNFFVWGNLNDSSILDDYATVYMFFQWLRIQSGSTGIYRDIIGAEDFDYRAVTGAAQKNISWFNSEGLLWKDLFEPWLAANYINADEGQYGYVNDSVLKNIKAKTAPAGTTSLPLLPGEAVYSITNNVGSTSSYTSNSGPNIKYAGLENDEAVNYDNTYPGGVLLTYNANNNKQSLSETGNITGEEKEPPDENALSLSAGDTGPQMPVRIDARDMLARNGRRAETEILNSAFPLKTAVFTIKAGDE